MGGASEDKRMSAVGCSDAQVYMVMGEDVGDASGLWVSAARLLRGAVRMQRRGRSCRARAVF